MIVLTGFPSEKYHNEKTAVESNGFLQPDLSIVIPALREEQRIGKTLDALDTFLKTDKLFKTKNVEIVVVSADSEDKTHEIILEKSKKFQNFKFYMPGPPIGKGRDVQLGMLKAQGKAVIFMDADLATPLYYLSQFFKEILAGADIVVGTRNLLKHHPNKLRRMISNFGNLLFRIVGNLWIEDSQCGFKMFSRKAVEICFTQLKILGWGFDMELLAIAKVNNLKIKHCRINDWISVPGGPFSTGIVKNSLLALRDLFYILVRRMLGKYKFKKS